MPEEEFQAYRSETVDYHQECYDKAKVRIDKHKNNIETILDIIDEFKHKRIMGFKFNHALEE